MDVVRDIIAFKRDGGELDEEKLAAFVAGVVDGTIPAYQASALLMAIVLRGFSRCETIALAHAMVAGGKTLDLSAVRRPVLDKHSSGGVGDKVTPALAPLVAACGGVFGKMSGRGLGHTGGTLDKLESIPGFRVQLSQGEFLHQLERIGVAVTAQSERIVPADRILYALRDVTATVDNDGLIAASIMAKKIATGTSAIVLDLKVGRGAFMKDIEQARDLAELCAAVGASYGRPVTSFFTAMDAPLGLAVGNRLEVEEAWEVLTDGGPPDVRELVLTLAGVLLALSDLGLNEEEGRARAERALAQGAAAETFQRWCASQGGTWRTRDGHRLGGAEVLAPHDGYVTGIDALLVGRAAQAAGAGRQRVDDAIDHAAGVLLAVRPGVAVAAGELLATAYARDAVRRRTASELLAGAFAIGDEKPTLGPLILGRTGGAASCGEKGD